MQTQKHDNGKTNGKEGAQAAAMAELSQGGEREITDITEASLVALYFVQRLGQVSVPEIHAKIREHHGLIDEHFLSQACEALQSRGLLAMKAGKQKGGLPVKMWKCRDVLWSKPPEMAHLVDLLPQLVETPEAKRFIDGMNRGEEEGDGTSKSNRKLKYGDMAVVEVEFETLDEFFGSQPRSAYLDVLLERSQYKAPGEAKLFFWRDATTGALCIPSDVFNGWMRTGLRDYGYSDVIGQYFAGANIHVHPKKQLLLSELPIISDGRGAGIGVYETLQPGERFRVTMRVPTRGMMPISELRTWLVAYGPNPLRGMSPARGARTGKVALTDFRFIGWTKGEADKVAAHNVTNLPEHLREATLALLAKKV